ncbi:sodium:sulfate symporter [Halorubellus sp. JP-L1]|uniref:SLC13 family permease n=1 Tax=Halorubellus sp. JP-L1 TaxID=2715753 RepID=UPI001408C788|nr:SLC13 family permease [Halorubellus sp. JP-L1]NHN42904.1 sodium:sulfate symporter [Halorubellus sp. JP-L1]
MHLRARWLRRESLPWLSVPVGVLAAIAILTAAPVDDATATMLAITVFCIVLWVATPVPPSFTGIVCIGLVGVTFSTDLALTGFQSATMWLVVFGLLLGEAARESGLAAWGGAQIRTLAWPAETDALAARVAYGRLLVVSCAAALAFALLVPSALVRILTLAPIVAKLGEAFDDDRARIGIFLGPLLVTFYAAPGIFTAGLPNIITTGIAESLGSTTASWTTWTLQMFPVMGFGRAVVVTAVVYLKFRPGDAADVSVPSGRSALRGSERRMLAFLLVGVLLWTTDAVHGLHPFFGALVVVLLALLPGVGVVTFDDLADTDFSIIFFLGAVFAIGAGLSETGFAASAAESLLTLIPTGAPLWLVLVLVFAATIALTFLMEGLAVASVLTPVLVSFAQRSGLPVDPLLMIESVALSTFFFPYQTVIFVAILGEGVVDAVTLVKTATWVSILATLLLLPLQIGLFVLLY